MRFIPIRALFFVATVLTLWPAGDVAAAGSRKPERHVVLERLAGLSIPFVVNAGQTDPEVTCYAQTFAGTVFVTREGKIVYALPPKRSGAEAGGWALTESLVGGRPRPTPEQPAAARVSTFLGTDPTRWQSDVTTYDAVSLGEVWESITVSLHAHGDNVEKLFTILPGGEASRIRVRVGGSRGLRLNGAGTLVAVTGLGIVTFTAPLAYQEKEGRRVPVDVAYTLRGSEYGFRVGRYDARFPVVIDPILQSTYLGGTGGDPAAALAIHPISGEVVVAGNTVSTDFPMTAGGAQPTPDNIFIARLNSTLTSLLQATYLGGAAGDVVRALAINPTSGDIYVAGDTSIGGVPTGSFPMTAGGAQAAHGGATDGFVARLNSSLTSLLQATYVGGSAVDAALGLAISGSGEVFVAGFTQSANLPNTTGGAQPAGGGLGDAFVARLNAALTSNPQATYLGGMGVDFRTIFLEDYFGAVTIHPTTGEVIVAGITISANFPMTGGGAQPAIGGSNDAFAARLNPTLTSLLQATYLGGSSADYALAVAVHPASGEIVVAGGTGSANFPNTVGGAQPVFAGGGDAFVARFNSTLTSLPQATYVGSNFSEFAASLAIHPISGEIYVGGTTNSNVIFPMTAGAAQPTYGGGTADAFIARLNSTLTAMPQATYLGGNGSETAQALVIRGSTSEVLVAGPTQSTNFPVTAGGAQPAFGAGNFDGFVSRITDDLAGAGGVTPTITPTITQTPTITPTPPLTPGGPTSTPTPTLAATLTPTIPPPTITAGGPGGPSAPIPTLSPGMLVALALGLAGVALVMFKRMGS